MTRPLRRGQRSDEEYTSLLGNHSPSHSYMAQGTSGSSALLPASDFTSPVHERLKEDTPSLHTIESSTSTNVTVDNLGDRQSLTASMNNYVQFTDSMQDKKIHTAGEAQNEKPEATDVLVDISENTLPKNQKERKPDPNDPKPS